MELSIKCCICKGKQIKIGDIIRATIRRSNGEPLEIKSPVFRITVNTETLEKSLWYESCGDIIVPLERIDSLKVIGTDNFWANRLNYENSERIIKGVAIC